jgi:diacylglycerol kinase
MPKKFIKSFKYAHAGARHALRTQRNIWIHLAIGVVVFIAAAYYRVSLAELALLVLTITAVIVAEMFNTAVEVLVDLVSPNEHEQAGLVKNVAAGAVLLAAGGAVAVGLLIFGPKVIKI